MTDAAHGLRMTVETLLHLATDMAQAGRASSSAASSLSVNSGIGGSSASIGPTADSSRAVTTASSSAAQLCPPPGQHFTWLSVPGLRLQHFSSASRRSTAGHAGLANCVASRPQVRPRVFRKDKDFQHCIGRGSTHEAAPSGSTGSARNGSEMSSNILSAVKRVSASAAPAAAPARAGARAAVMDGPSGSSMSAPRPASASTAASTSTCVTTSKSCCQCTITAQML